MPRPTRFDLDDPDLDRLADHADHLRAEAKDRAMERAMNLDPVVTVTIRDAVNPSLSFDMPIDRRLWRDATRPLPRGREIILGDKLDGMGQQTARHRLASSVAQHVASTLAAHFAKDDTTNGYSRQQWEAMARHEKSGESEDSRET